MLAKGLNAWLSLFMVVLPLSLGLTSVFFFPLLGLWILGASYTFARWPPLIGMLEKQWAVYLFVSALSTVCGLAIAHGFREIWNKDFYFLLYALLAALVTRAVDRDRYVLIFWTASIVAALLGIVQWGLAFWIHAQPTGAVAHLMAGAPHSVQHVLDLWSGRSPGPRSHPIRYSEDLMFALALSVGFLSSSTPRRRLMWLVGAWVLCLGIVFSQTRGTWLAVAVIILAGLVSDRRRLTRSHVLLVLMPIVLVGLAAGLRTRFTSMWDKDQKSNTERVDMWKAGAHVFIHHPFLGTGPGTTRQATTPYLTPLELTNGGWGHLHNTFITMGAERGALGVGAFLVLMGGFAVALWRRIKLAETPDEKGLCRGALLGWIGFLLCGLTEMDYNNADVSLTFFAVMGLALSRVRPSTPS